jgi:hypothetical protein
VKYRPHRGSLDDAMREVVEIDGRAALLRVLNNEMGAWGYMIDDADVRIERYVFDERIGWDTHIVTIRNKRNKAGIWYFGEDMGPDYFGAVGFTNGAV